MALRYVYEYMRFVVAVLTDAEVETACEWCLMSILYSESMLVLIYFISHFRSLSIMLVMDFTALALVPFRRVGKG